MIQRLYLGSRSDNLSGRIPIEIAMLTQLTRLDVDNNRLTGSIPSELDLLTHLNELSLEDNKSFVLLVLIFLLIAERLPVRVADLVLILLLDVLFILE